MYLDSPGDDNCAENRKIIVLTSGTLYYVAERNEYTGNRRYEDIDWVIIGNDTAEVHRGKYLANTRRT